MSDREELKPLPEAVDGPHTHSQSSSAREDLRDALINKLMERMESIEGLDPEMTADHLLSVFDASTYAGLLKLPGAMEDQTLAQIGKFAVKLAWKLHAAELKYGYGLEWMEDGWRLQCQKDLLEHVKKGDPLDVAAYCMFADYHGWSSNVQLPGVDPKIG